MRRRVLLMLAPALASAQAFEVATVKPSAGDNKGRYITMPSAHRFVAHNHTVRTLIAAAWSVTPKTVYGGPEWMDSEAFDILAGTPGERQPRLDEQMAMLRTLLTDRFGLVFHREQRELPYYALRTAKGGAKLRPGAEPAGGQKPLIFVLSPQGAVLPARNATMGELAAVMQRAAVDRPVLDETGQQGRFDFDLEWTPDETQFGGNGPKAPDEPTRPDLFAALQVQLGLKLEAAKGPVPVLVVDQVRRPSEN